MKQAVADLSWLRTRGYAERSATKLVGDRYQLRQRQRIAVGRCACADAARTSREARRVGESSVAGGHLVIDGLNVITTIEVALAGGVLSSGRDGCLRDMASFHGSYRLVDETERAVEIVVGLIHSMRPAAATIYIDQPVSNSGRLAEVIRQTASVTATTITALTAQDVDGILMRSESIVATADSAIVDRCGSWISLARIAVERHEEELPPLWLLDLS